jgi:hypothetical protein
MLSRGCYLLGLFSALLALMAQLSAGATVPRLDPVAQLVGAEALCHETHNSGGAPAKAPVRPIESRCGFSNVSSSRGAHFARPADG